MEDLPFIDGLQKKHTKQVGFMPTKALEGKVRAGHVLVAEEMNVDGGMLNVEGEGCESLQPSTINHQQSPTRVGYFIGNDQYFKRDDCGIIYQMNVVPGKQTRICRRDAAEGAVRAIGVWVQVVLLLVCAGHRGESVLGVDGFRSAGVSGGE